MEAASTIEKQLHKIERLEEQNLNLSLASKFMVESLFDIISISKDRDKKQKKTTDDLLDEISLRLKECGNIASDTLRLDSVNRAFEKMKD
jgi:hypothetical protein